ncbi:MAG: hypothetical protein IPN18_08040 [Ignavibacteriales bacterium]|nr:hypothetical protein [Ignavibacteriales bacterium]
MSKLFGSSTISRVALSTTGVITIKGRLIPSKSYFLNRAVVSAASSSALKVINLGLRFPF